MTSCSCELRELIHPYFAIDLPQHFASPPDLSFLRVLLCCHESDAGGYRVVEPSEACPNPCSYSNLRACRRWRPAICTEAGNERAAKDCTGSAADMLIHAFEIEVGT